MYREKYLEKQPDRCFFEILTIKKITEIFKIQFFKSSIMRFQKKILENFKLFRKL